MNQKVERDEREQNLENRMNSHAFHMAAALFILSILAKTLFYRGAVVWSESMMYIDFLVFLIPVGYTFITRIRHGRHSFHYGKKYMIIGLFLGLAVAAMIVLLSSHPDKTVVYRHAWWGFAIGAGGVNIVYFLLTILSRKLAKQCEERIIEECNDE